jgi:hypothetical protein
MADGCRQTSFGQTFVALAVAPLTHLRQFPDLLTVRVITSHPSTGPHVSVSSHRRRISSARDR